MLCYYHYLCFGELHFPTVNLISCHITNHSDYARFAWTSFRFVHWIVPIIASAFFGAGIYIVILAVLNYVVDSYQTYSASSLAGVILIRNLVGAGFPLFASQMYHKLGLEWASTLLAFLSLLFVPIPLWWFYRGESLRLKSPWAREHFHQAEDSPH